MDEMHELKVLSKTEARLDVGEESIVFTTTDGKQHELKLSAVVGSPEHMLMYAQVIMLRTVVQQQAGLAGAMTQLAQSMSQLVAAIQNAPTPQPPDLDKTVATAVGSLVGALKSAGVPLPLAPPGVGDGNRSKS